MKRDPLSVFVNVPLDDHYEQLLRALIFTITACGYRVRCALEDDDSANIRMDKLEGLIRESPRSIHDLSRVELGKSKLPRFNMPFELGLAVGAKMFGRGRKSDQLKIVVRDDYILPTYMSDLGGNDPAAHRGLTDELIKIVGRFLHEAPSGKLVPGAAHLIGTFAAFNVALPALAADILHLPDEVTALRSYRIFLSCVVEYLKTNPAIV